METQSTRSFRQVLIPYGTEITLRSVRTGKVVNIKIRNLYPDEKQILNTACDFIEEKLAGSSFEKDIRILYKLTGFCVTSSRHVGAYSGWLKKDSPIVVLNKGLFMCSTDEFKITILHELLHFATKLGDENPQSLDEAKHDLACYGLLGIPVSINHWAFIKYPYLKDEILSNLKSSVI